MNKNSISELGVELHKNVPPDWYYTSIRTNLGQKFWHNFRFREVKKIIDPVENGKILDIGCADGVFTNIILKKSHAKEIIGIDILEASIKWAKKHWHKNKKLKFQVGDAHQLNFPSNTFDAVFMLEALEHVENPQKVFEEIKRVLKKNGYAVLLVPTDSILFRIIWFFWTKFWKGKIWNDCHIQSFSKTNRLATSLKKIGFEIKDDKNFLFGMLNLVKVYKV